MTDEQFHFLEKLVLQPLKSRGASLFIFGSRAVGSHHSHSDVDILFELPANDTLPPGFLAKITEDIEESRFPFKVDLVDSRYLAQSYRPGVESQKKPL